MKLPWMAALVVATVIGLFPAVAAAVPVLGPDLSTGTYTLNFSGDGDPVDLQERLLPNGSFANVASHTRATSKTFNKAVEGTYAYRARACTIPEPGHPEVCGAWGPTKQVQVVFIPTVPGSLGSDTTEVTGNYTLSWAASTGAAAGVSYTFQEARNGAWGAGVPGLQVTSMAYTNKPDGTYQYRVKACNLASPSPDQQVCSALTATRTITALHTPGRVLNLATPASSTTGNFGLTWSTAQYAVSYYHVEERLQGAAGFSHVANVAGTSYGVAAHADGVYEFRVTACNATCGPSSDVVTVNILKPPLPPTFLAAPGAERGSGRYAVQWGASPQSTVAAYELDTREAAGAWTTLRTQATEKPERRNQPATLTYRVRACNATACSGYTAELSVAVTPRFPDIVEDGPIVHQPVPEQAPIGTLDGKAGVEGGAAAYSVPLPVPPGRQAVEPAVSLHYSSKGGNGLVGVGWSLETGAAIIYRCPWTVAQDTRTRAVDFSDNDRLCLDGERLMRKSGDYGKSGSEYRTEIDQFARITLQGDISQATSFFKIEHKSGLVTYLGNDGAIGSYGNTNGVFVPRDADGKVTAPMAWKQRRLEDPQGNSILYSYGLFAGEHVLVAIEYTGRQQTAGDRRMIFQYAANRPDSRVSFQAGAVLPARLRLDSVQTYVGSALVRWYQLAYRQSGATGRELLASLQECEGASCSGVRLPATTFAYNENAIAFQEVNVVPGTANEPPKAHIILLEDFDGDGARDSLYREWASGAPGSPLVKRELRLTGRTGAVNLLGTPWLDWFFDSSSVTPIGSGHDTDVDRDGVADLTGRVNGNFAAASPEAQTRITSDLGLGASDAVAEIGDYDGDGDNDVLVREGTLLRWHRNVTPPGQEGFLSFDRTVVVTAATLKPYERLDAMMDVNGDGLLDLFMDWNGSVVPSGAVKPQPEIALASWDGSNVRYDTKTLQELGATNAPFREENDSGFFDANGDGLPDLYKLPGQFWINQGRLDADGKNLFVALTDAAGDPALAFPRFPRPGSSELWSAAHHLYGAVMVMDVDGDGAQELLIPAELVGDFCYERDLSGDGTEPVCGHGWAIGPKPDNDDRSVYRWAAIRVRTYVPGQATFERVLTSLVAPVYASTVQDAYGDGLPDVRYEITNLFGQSDQGWRAIGTYDGGAGATFGWNVAKNRGADGASGVTDGLARVTNGVGGQATWRYAALSSGGDPQCANRAFPDIPRPISPAIVSLPFYQVARDNQDDPDAFPFTSSMQVVSRFEQNDDLAGLKTATCFRYQDATFSRTGRGFLGFRVIHEEDDTASDREDNLRTTTTFETTFPFAGKPRFERKELVSELPDGESAIRFVRHDWAAQNNGSGLWNVYQTDETTTNSDLRSRLNTDSRATHYVRNATDRDRGNVTTTEVTVREGSGGSLTTDVYVQRTTNVYDYADADAGTWWLDKLASQTTVYEPRNNPAPVPDADLNSRKTVTVLSEWYPRGHANQRQLKKETTQDGIPGQWRRKTYAYNAFGNRTSQLVEAAALSASRTTTWRYSPDGYFAIAEANPQQQEVTMDSSPATGAITHQDQFGILTDFTYDAFGRRLDETQPGVPTIHHRLAACTASSPSGCAYRQLTIQDGTPARSQTFDRLGHEIETRSTGFSGTDVVTTKTYDAHGRLLRESVPTDAGQPTSYTRYSRHDALGRVGTKTVERTGQSPTEFVTQYRYTGLTTEITLPIGRLSRTYDSLGHIMETVDAAGGITRYRYDGRGGLVLLLDPALPTPNTTKAHFDDLGRRLDISDSNRGTARSVYDGLGQLIQETTANGDVITTDYDRLGRTTYRRLNGVMDAELHYDGAQPGLLDVELGPDGFRREYVYDALRRPIKTTTFIDGHAFAVEQGYDGYYGRLKAVRYPGGEVVGTTFDANGYALTAYDPLAVGADFVYKRVTGMTARGQLAGAQFGNGLIGTYDFYASTGQAKRIRVQALGPTPSFAQDLDYRYNDWFMNLTGQFNGVRSVWETFEYDGLQRLTKTERTRGTVSETITYGYDALGNIMSKGDFGAYTYGTAARSSGNAGPSAVHSVTRPDGTVIADFQYDLAGNMLAGLGRSLQYNAYNQPIVIESNGHATSFAYTPDLKRLKQVSGSRTTYYVQDTYEYVVDGGQVEERTYVGNELLLRQSGATREVRYIHRDQLGSVDTITDETGAVVEVHGFDPFGKPLSSDWHDTGGLLHSGEFAEQNTNRGFTGHEHLDDHGLIHMTGRAYDPALGRFLSADPFIQDIKNSQNLNPYTYLLNNPLSGVDPTGYQEAKKLDGTASAECTIEGDTPEGVNNGNGKSAEGSQTESNVAPDELCSQSTQQQADTTQAAATGSSTSNTPAPAPAPAPAPTPATNEPPVPAGVPRTLAERQALVQKQAKEFEEGIIRMNNEERAKKLADAAAAYQPPPESTRTAKENVLCGGSVTVFVGTVAGVAAGEISTGVGAVLVPGTILVAIGECLL